MQRIHFAAIGLDHPHIFSMTEVVQSGGGVLTHFYGEDEQSALAYVTRFPAARRVFDKKAILENAQISLVLSAAIPSQRAGIGLEVMAHGKDFLCDKAAFLNLESLETARRVQRQTGRIFAISYSERLLERGAWRAGKLVQAGAIGRVVHQTILAPHGANLNSRAPWFFEKSHFGGILTDIASHQIEQFLFYAGLETARVESAFVANVSHPQFAEWEDFGETTLRGQTRDGHSCGAFIRVDWLSPEGGGHNGRHRALLGTDGLLEIGHSSLQLTDKTGSRTVDCAQTTLDFGRLLVDDVLNRTQTAIQQEHCFYASQLALEAQRHAEKSTHS